MKIICFNIASLESKGFVSESKREKNHKFKKVERVRLGGLKEAQTTFSCNLTAE